MKAEEDFSILEASLILFFAVAMRSITTFIHELGHAIPALLFSRKEVKIFVGSYGDPKTGITFNVGRLKVYFKFNSFNWGQGMCVYYPDRTNRLQSMFITAAGPFISLLTATLLIVVLNQYEFGKASWFILMLLIFSSIWDFIINMIPLKDPIKLFSGEEVHSDGYVLMKLWRGEKRTDKK